MQNSLSEGLSRLAKRLEYASCAVSPVYFLLKYAIIKSTEGGFIPFKLYVYQVKCLLAFLLHNLIIILKNRQIGCTWLVAGYALWKALFHRAANIIIVSKSEDAATEVLDYCRFIYNNLPDFLKPPMDKDRTSLISFPSIGSKIRALSSKESSGIGFGSASLVILDENDFHPYAEENYVEIKPMIDAGGNRQLIILSAPNRMKLNSNFKAIWRDARKGKNNFHPILLTLGSVPHQTDEWYERMKREYTKRDLETRYFKTEEEALSVTVAGKFFDMDKLTMHTSRIIAPLEGYDTIDTRNGMIRIFKPPVGSNKYVLFTDPSEGKEDPFHMVVIEVGTKEEVANAHGWFPSDEVASIHDTLSRHYNASNSYYRTGYTGGRFQSALDNLNTPSQMYSRSPDGKPKIGQYGYWESRPLKKQLLGSLRDGIYSMEYVIHDAETLDELCMMIWEEGDDMPKVPDKEHDDRIIALCGAVDLVNRIPRGDFESFSMKYGG